MALITEVTCSRRLGMMMLFCAGCTTPADYSTDFPDHLSVAGMHLSANANIEEGSLQVVLEFVNIGNDSVHLRLMGGCPFLISLSDAEGHVYWREDRECLSWGQHIDLASGESESVDRSLPISTLPEGEATVLVRVVADSLWPPFSAGEVRIGSSPN